MIKIRKKFFLKKMDNENLFKELEELVFRQEKPIQENTEEITDWEILIKKDDKTKNNNIALLEKLQLDRKIFDIALYYYNKTLENSKLKKIKFKNAIMCSCVFLAFSINGDHREENSLMQHFNVDKKKYTKGLKMIKTTISDVRIIKNSFDNDLFFLCREMNILSDLVDIKKYLEKNIDYYSERNPYISSKTILCALFYAWLLQNKKFIPSIETFAEICNLSHKSIKRILYRHTEILHNFVNKIITEKLLKFKETLNVEISLVEKNYYVKNSIKEMFFV